MATLELVLLLMAAVLISSVLDQLIPWVSSPLIQIALGLIISLFASEYIIIDFDSDLFLVLFIAPLLYDEARNSNKAALYHNIKPVLGLAIGLVVITMIVLGCLMHLIMPYIPLAAALALAAALGPTDAVAVSSLPDDISMSERHRNILRGEYLLNDASGIVTFQFAIAAVIYGSFNIADAASSFAISFVGGIIVGAILGYIANIAAKYTREMGIENLTFHVMFDLFVPFIIYLISEPFGASGIIAVVVGGLVRGAQKTAIGPVESRLNIVSSSVWRTVSFALNGFVFVLLGTQLPKAMQGTWDNVALPNEWLFICVILFTLILMAIRFIWWFYLEYFLNYTDGRKFFSKESLRNAAMMTLAGPKGAVTLSIMLTIPTVIGDAFFPQRELLIFVSCGIILLTLLASNFVLPLIAPRNTTPEHIEEEKQKAIEATLEIFRLVIQELTANQTKENRKATQSVIKEYNRRIKTLKRTHDIESNSTEDLHYFAVTLEITRLQNLIQSGQIDPKLGYKHLKKLNKIERAQRKMNSFERMVEYLRKQILGLQLMFARLKKTVSSSSSIAEQEAYREIQFGSLQYIIDTFQDALAAEDISKTPHGAVLVNYDPEDISQIILRYQSILTRVRNQMPSFTSLSIDNSHLDEMKRTGFKLEQNIIQDMYDEGRIDRKTAKSLRDNVRLMQLDLEDEELSE